jgi:hypothetical protein
MSLVSSVSFVLVACSAPTRDLSGGDDPAPDTRVQDAASTTDTIEDDRPTADVAFGEIGEQPVDDASAPEAACAATVAATTRTPVDLVMSIDQSGSMDDDIAKVRASVANLAADLSASGLDWRLIMIARVGSGPLEVCVPEPVAGPRCASKAPRFLAVDKTVTSHDTLTVTLETLPRWTRILRQSAVKIFVPITDDESTQMTAVEFDRRLLAAAPEQFGTAAARRYVYFPICGASAFPSTVKCGPNAVDAGAQYQALARLTKGEWSPICAPDFRPVFERIARNIANRIACEITIPPPPAGSTFDRSKVNVSYRAGPSAVRTTIPRDDSGSCESGANGWRYSGDGTKILLCGRACARVQGLAEAQVDVEFGCASKYDGPK